VLDVEMPWRLRGRGEHLEREVALDHAREVDVSMGAALEQIAAPQQRIGVEIRDE
jgi:hypothetical protein